jgi:hypothetical protein
VIALAYHVDYWDYIGWKDPFAKAEFSARQEAYARALPSHLYTPQAVVGGTADVVGSNRERVAAAVARAAPPVMPVQVEAKRDGHLLRIHASAPKMVASLALEIAVTESGVVTEVTRGENAGRKLVADHIVRVLAEAGPDGTLAVPLDAAWGRLDVVAFVQDRKTMRILGAATAPVAN